MDGTMLMAGLTGIAVAGVILFALKDVIKDCWPKLKDLPKVKMVVLKN